MVKGACFGLLMASLTGTALAQDYVGSASVGSSEPLYSYDDQEKWKHGWLQEMPYYHGYHSFRPYNYHHVFGQTQTANAWGLHAPYSQQFWHRYQAVPGGIVTPVPQVYSYGQQMPGSPMYQPVWTPAPQSYVPPQPVTDNPAYQPTMVEGYAIPPVPAALPTPGY